MAMPFTQKQFRDLVKQAQKFQKEADEKGYGRISAQPTQQISQFPHCDARILHAPGECKYCDGHPEWQELREVWRVNFTGHHDNGKMMCPSELSRPVDQINQWGGNRPTVHLIEEEPDAG